VELPASSTSEVSVEQVVSGLTPNTIYVFSGWGEVASSGDTVVFGVKEYGGGSGQLTSEVNSISYTHASITFTTGSSSTSARIFFYKSQGSGAAFGDDFSLKAQ
jgi:hypothetical protein